MTEKRELINFLSGVGERLEVQIDYAEEVESDRILIKGMRNLRNDIDKKLKEVM